VYPVLAKKLPILNIKTPKNQWYLLQSSINLIKKWAKKGFFSFPPAFLNFIYYIQKWSLLFNKWHW